MPGVAFCTAIAKNAERVYDETFLRDMVHDVFCGVSFNARGLRR